VEDHAADKRDNSRKLWTILIFMIWHRIYIEKAMTFTNPSTVTE